MMCKKDPLMVELGNTQARKIPGMDPQKKKHLVSQEMRIMARRLDYARALDT